MTQEMCRKGEMEMWILCDAHIIDCIPCIVMCHFQNIHISHVQIFRHTYASIASVCLWVCVGLWVCVVARSG